MRDPRAVAVNVAANTNQPGFRGPVYPDGSFAYVPIPESAATLPRERFPVDEPLPTYADLDLPFAVPSDLHATPVHLDPELPGVHGRDRATYGDPHGVKAGRIAGLAPGDWLLFYATLSLRPHGWPGPGGASADAAVDGDPAPDADLAPDWGAYLFAGIRVERVLAVGDGDRSETGGGTGDAAVDRESAAALAPTNAHLKRDPFDARVVVAGDPAASGRFERVVPLSDPEAGADANRLVTALSSDSGKGPWWRRPMAFDADATATLLERIERA
ncbi:MULTISPECIES: hypothetical protein [unclassified Halorubrum]|uniref:Nmad3 family putative nucleotide modification protein n=1 Tax=unclassified Halorubrum TaxID=2642239 RepID=UPI000B97D6B1|nr:MULTISPECIES: hypothetical protein [unclassified Halorubrum]OYR39779.1 hypothetical protein DJ81_15710 [Halorubrum sp. Hd13]OYR48377.1 hypothetical protein DJ74_10845 [Halorubrum sp. Ea8]